MIRLKKKTPAPAPAPSADGAEAPAAAEDGKEDGKVSILGIGGVKVNKSASGVLLWSGWRISLD